MNPGCWLIQVIRLLKGCPTNLETMGATGSTTVSPSTVTETVILVVESHQVCSSATGGRAAPFANVARTTASCDCTTFNARRCIC